MEKSITPGYLALASGSNQIATWQLEGGLEECQIKRIVFSGNELGSEYGVTMKLGLFQKAPSTTADFTDDTVIYAMSFRNQQLINETTTVRVPQGWHIGLWIQNNPGGTLPCTIGTSIQLNYLNMT